MYGRVTNCIKCLNFLSDETLGYGGSAVALFKKNLSVFLCFVLEDIETNAKQGLTWKKKKRENTPVYRAPRTPVAF